MSYRIEIPGGLRIRVPMTSKSKGEEIWKQKVKEIVKVSKFYGYREQDKEFWTQQPCGVISLILEIYKDLNTVLHKEK